MGKREVISFSVVEGPCDGATFQQDAADYMLKGMFRKLWLQPNRAEVADLPERLLEYAWVPERRAYVFVGYATALPEGGEQHHVEA